MSFSAVFYSMSKAINSTKIPTTGGTVYNCNLKKSTSIIAPEIELYLGESANPTIFNYVYISLFNRYYFVNDWINNEGLWILKCETDVMASFKSDIGSSTCYVLRAQNAADGTIKDDIYPLTGDTTSNQQTQATPWALDQSAGNGVYVIGVAGSGGTKYYIMSRVTMISFFAALFSDGFANQLTDNWVSVFPELKAQSNPLQYITTVQWLPFSASGDSISTIKVGWVSMGVSGAYEMADDGIVSGVKTFSIPTHPQASRGSYLNNAPFSTYSVFFPPFGKIALDADVMANITTLALYWYVDIRTGGGTLKIADGNGKIMSWVHAQVGQTIQVSQVVSKGFGIGNLIAPAITATVGVATGNPLGVISGVASGIGDFAGSKIPSATTIGSSGGVNSLVGDIHLLCEFKTQVDIDIAAHGKPLCELRTISALGGYIKTSNAYIATDATQEEKEKILSYMDGGFIYE